jgi:hypothetical protein
MFLDIYSANLLIIIKAFLLFSSAYQFDFLNCVPKSYTIMPKSKAVNTVEDAEKVAAELGYPVVIRPAYTMGGTGGGLVYNVEELRTIAGRGLSASIVNQVLIEESVLGWEELEDKLGTQMQAVGEVMSIGKTYKEALQKAIRSLEIGRYGLGFAKDFNKKPLDELMNMLNHPSSERQFIMYEALRKGADIEELNRKTYIKTWFIQQMKELVELEEKILGYRGMMLPNELLITAKKNGFADRYLSKLLKGSVIL